MWVASFHLFPEQRWVCVTWNASAVLRKEMNKYLFHRMKKKQKRPASSSPSSSSTRSSSCSSSSSSSSRKRSKKKKKKKHKSEQGSRRHRRVSSRESRRSEEDKGKKDGEEEEEEWYPAPSNTSATFLNQKGGPGFQEEVEERRISHIYSLSAASDEDWSDSLYRGRKGRDKEQDKRKSSRNSLSRSPEKGERVNRWKEEFRKDARRSSIDEHTQRRTSCSSTEAENTWKVSVNQVEVRRQERRNSSEGGRYQSRAWQERQDSERVEKDGRKERAEKESSNSGGSSSRSEGSGGSLTSASRPRKDLPSNLLDIFSQIAQFEKEKGIKPK